MTRILVLEEISPAGLEALRAEPDFEVKELYQDDPVRLRVSLETADALIVRSKTRVTADFLRQASNLKVIGRPGTGVDNVDVAAATLRGIVVMNTPAGNSVSVAEHTMGLILALVRKIPAADTSMKQGKWDRHKFMGAELCDKVLGIIGLGKVGMEVVRRAQSFKMRILVCDPFVSAEAARDVSATLVPMEELLAKSDIVSLHVPLTPATRRLINAGSIALMRNGAYLINAARGDLVDESALLEALWSGKLSGAALDVFIGEPKPNPELAALPNVVATPHIGASTREAQEKVGYDIALQIRDYFRDGIIRNAVNFPSVSLAEYRAIAPFLQLGEKVGAFASQISEGRLHEVAVGYFGELNGVNTHLICSSILVGVLKPVMEGVTLVNAMQTAKERGIHFIESRSTCERGYGSLISVRLRTDRGEEWVEGTVMHRNHLHITSLYGIDIDAPLQGDMLIIRNTDTPGVIGRVGSILGENQINIANFALGRGEETHEAVGVVNVDSAIPGPVLEAIGKLAQVRRARIAHV